MRGKDSSRRSATTVDQPPSTTYLFDGLHRIFNLMNTTLKIKFKKYFIIFETLQQPSMNYSVYNERDLLEGSRWRRRYHIGFETENRNGVKTISNRIGCALIRINRLRVLSQPVLQIYTYHFRAQKLKRSFRSCTPSCARVAWLTRAREMLAACRTLATLTCTRVRPSYHMT